MTQLFYTIKSKTSIKSNLSPLAKPFEPASYHHHLEQYQSPLHLYLLYRHAAFHLHRYRYLHLCVPSPTSVILPSPETVRIVPFQSKSVVHKPTSQVLFAQCSSPHISSSLSFTPTSKPLPIPLPH